MVSLKRIFGRKTYFSQQAAPYGGKGSGRDNPEPMPKWCVLSSLILLVACTSEPTPAAAESDGETTEPDRLDAAQSLLQGKWERQSYPHGTIEFDGARVKFTPGEGMAELPEFRDYELADSCPDIAAVKAAPTEFDFVVVHDGENCDAIKLNGDEFTIYYAGSGEGVEYAREE